MLKFHPEPMAILALVWLAACQIEDIRPDLTIPQAKFATTRIVTLAPSTAFTQAPTQQIKGDGSAFQSDLSSAGNALDNQAGQSTAMTAAQRQAMIAARDRLAQQAAAQTANPTN